MTSAMAEALYSSVKLLRGRFGCFPFSMSDTISHSPLVSTEPGQSHLISTRASESLTLDFKAAEALDTRDQKKRIELTKDVSAFANSAGGTIVYGLVEGENHVAERLDNGFDSADPIHEWVENVINSKIHRRISGIQIRRVELL